MAATPETPHPDTPDAPIDGALFVLDRHGAVTSWNTAAATASGYNAGELYGTAFDRLFTTGAAPGDIAAALRIAGRNGRFNARGWFTRKDGGRVEALLVIEAIHGKKGALAGFAATVGDLAAHRHTAGPLVDGDTT